jgi:crotonobetainyl-CoA:carnitine CoA-transferase CaiB-like acyl-CoA transferase
MGRYTRADWITKLDAAGIPCAPLHRLGELANHAHTQASGMVLEYKHPAFGTLKTVSQPLRINGARAGLDRHPPLRGEHTHEVLKELGFNDDFIGQLVSAGVARAAG